MPNSQRFDEVQKTTSSNLTLKSENQTSVKVENQLERLSL
jgi:hypothetical protein